MSEVTPVVKLTYAILLSALKKAAERIVIRAKATNGATVLFHIGGAVHEEMRPPIGLLVPMVQRLSIMAELPPRPRGAPASGFIHLIIGEHRHAYFAISVTGHDLSTITVLDVMTEQAYCDATSTGFRGE